MSEPLPLPVRKAPRPPDEALRLALLRSYRLLDTGPEPAFDALAALAGLLFRAPMALVALCGEERNYFKGRAGVSVTEVPRDESFCAHAILGPHPFIVPNAPEDERFAWMPWVAGEPCVRFYAGMPLRAPEGQALGTLCVFDHRPRALWDDGQSQTLADLGRQVMVEMERRRACLGLAEHLRAWQTRERMELLEARLITAIAAAPGVHAAIRVAVEEICANAGWAAGAAWIFGSRGGAGRSVAWHARRSEIEPLRGACARRRPSIEFPPPGRAAPLWFEPGGGDPVGEAALRCGFGAGVRFPVRINGAAALLEFWMPGRNAAEAVAAERIGSALETAAGALRRKRMEERLRQHEAELKKINRIKDRFLATLAHELRNPLTPILNATALLRTSRPGDAVEIIERQARHMARLVDDLLDVSRISEGKMTCRKVRLNLAEPVRAAARAAEGLFAGRGQPFTVSLCQEPLWLEGDPVRIEQIVGNLLHNAAKYTDPDDAVELTLSREGREAVLRVRDEGIGIPKAAQARIFEPFVQSAETPSRRCGLGLGLAVVRQLAMLHGGSVRAQSEGAGLGAEFTVCLPLAEGPAAVATLPAPPAREGNGASRRVLIVDDHNDVAETLKRLLTLWGHRVETAPSGMTALARAEEFRPEVALIDLGLPGLDGYAVAERLAATAGLGTTRLVAISGYGHQRDRQRAVRAGFHDYMLKPIDPAALRELVAATGA